MDKIQKGEIKSLGTIDFQLDNGVEGCFVLTEGDTFIRTEIFTEDKPGHFGTKYHSHTMTKPQPPEEPYEPEWEDLNRVIGLSRGRELREVLKRLDIKLTRGGK